MDRNKKILAALGALTFLTTSGADAMERKPTGEGTDSPMTQSLHATRAQLKRLTSEGKVDLLRRRLGEVKSERNAARAENEDLRRQLKELEGRGNSSMLSTGSSRGLRLEMVELEGQIDELKQDKQDLHEQLDKKDAKCKSLLIRVKRGEDEAEQLRAKLKKAERRDQVGELTKELEDARAQLKDLRSSLSNLEDDRGVAARKIESLNAQIKDKEAEIERLRAAKEAEIEDLKVSEKQLGVSHNKQVREVKKELNRAVEAYREMRNLAYLASAVSAFPLTAQMVKGVGNADPELLRKILYGNEDAALEFVEGYEPEVAEVDGFGDLTVEPIVWVQSVSTLMRAVCGESAGAESGALIEKAKYVAYLMSKALEQDEGDRDFIEGMYFPIVRQLVALAVASKMKQDGEDTLVGVGVASEQYLDSFDESIDASFAGVNDIDIHSVLKADEYDEEEGEDQYEEEDQYSNVEDEKSGATEGNVSLSDDDGGDKKSKTSKAAHEEPAAPVDGAVESGSDVDLAPEEEAAEQLPVAEEESYEYEKEDQYSDVEEEKHEATEGNVSLSDDDDGDKKSETSEAAPVEPAAPEEKPAPEADTEEPAPEAAPVVVPGEEPAPEAAPEEKPAPEAAPVEPAPKGSAPEAAPVVVPGEEPALEGGDGASGSGE